MATHMDRMKPWLDSFAEDVGVLKSFVAAKKASRDARLLGAAALSYLVTQMDLIPDWEETAGILDDAMVMRLAAAAASDKGLGDVPEPVERSLARLANEVETIEAFLGGEIYPRLRKYVHQLVDKQVRGRTAATIVDDEKAQTALFAEVSDTVQRLPAASIKDADAVARTLKNYITTKLK